MPTVATVFALLAGVAGWYYLFYSNAARRLAAVEAEPINARRQSLRRLNGGVLVALGGLFYAGFRVDPRRWPLPYAAVWGIVMVLLLVVVALVLIDMRLTARLRRRTKP